MSREFTRVPLPLEPDRKPGPPGVPRPRRPLGSGPRPEVDLEVIKARFDPTISVLYGVPMYQ